RQDGKRLAPPAAVAARTVARAQSCDLADVDIGETAEQPAPSRPVADRAAGHIPGADHDIGLPGRGNQRREMTRIVRKICVHLADEVHGLAEAAPNAV